MNRRLFVGGTGAAAALALLPRFSAAAQESEIETAARTFTYKGRTQHGVFVYTFIAMNGETTSNARIGFATLEADLESAIIDFWADNDDVELGDVEIDEISDTHTLAFAPVVSVDYEFTFAMDLRREGSYILLTLCLGGVDAIDDMTEFLDEFYVDLPDDASMEDILPTDDDLPSGYNLVEEEDEQENERP